MQALAEVNIPFYEICIEHLSKMNKLQVRLKEVESSDELKKNEDFLLLTERNNILHELHKEACIVVIFASSSLESFIYKYAIFNLSHKYFEQHLDKLSTISKWELIPRLVTNESIPDNSRGLNLLKELIKQRNDIIHYKGIAFTSFDNQEKIINRLENYSYNLYRCAGNAKDTIKSLLNELTLIDTREQLKDDIDEFLEI